MRVFVTRGIGVNILVRRAGDDRILIIRHNDIERTRHRLTTIIHNRVCDGGGADRIVVVGCLVGDGRDAGIVVGRGEGRHRQIYSCVVLASVCIYRHVARTCHDVQGLGFHHRHGIEAVVNRTAVGVGHRHRVLASDKSRGRSSGLVVIPKISVRSGAVGSRHRSRTVIAAMAGDRRAGEVFYRRQRRHRHVDGHLSGLSAAILHRHHHIPGGRDHRALRLVLRDDEVGRGDAVVGSLGAHIGGEIRNGELTLCRVDIGRFRGDHRVIDNRRRYIFYIIYILPIFVCLVTGRVLVGVNHLAGTGDGGRLQFPADKLDIRDGAVTAVFHYREAGVQNHGVGRQVEIQRSGRSDALHRFLTVSRNAPGAGVDRDHTSVRSGGTAHRIRAIIFYKIGICSFAGIVIKINTERTGVTSGMGMGGHHRFSGFIRTDTSLPSSGECRQVVGKRGGYHKSRIIRALCYGVRNGYGNARIHINFHFYSHCLRIADTDAISRSDRVGSDGRARTCGIKRVRNYLAWDTVWTASRYTSIYRRSSPCVIGLIRYDAFCGCYHKFIAGTDSDTVRTSDRLHSQDVVQSDVNTTICCTTFRVGHSDGVSSIVAITLRVQPYCHLTTTCVVTIFTTPRKSITAITAYDINRSGTIVGRIARFFRSCNGFDS